MQTENYRIKSSPAKWTQKPLAQLLQSMTSGSRPSGGGSTEAGGVFSIGGEHITNWGTLDCSNGVYVPIDYFERIRQQAEVRHRDILINKDGANTGKLGIARQSYLPEQACINEHVFRLRTKATELDQTYAFFFLLSPFGQSQVLPLVQGSAQPGLNQRFTKRVRVWFPTDLNEQAAIAHALDAVDTAIDCTRVAVERARELDHSLLHELLANGLNPTRLSAQKHPPHWKLRRVDEVAEVGSGVTLGKDVSGFKAVELPYLRVANVQDSRLDLSTVKSVRVRLDEVEDYRLEAGDILMTEGGDIDKLGRGTIWEGQIPVCLHQNHVFRIRPNRELLEPGFYSLIVESDIAKRYFNRVAKRTTNLASTNKTQVRAFRFPLPPTVGEQRQIVEVMKAAKATLGALLARQTALSELKKALMHDLLTGRIRVTSKIAAAAT